MGSFSGLNKSLWNDGKIGVQLVEGQASRPNFISTLMKTNRDNLLVLILNFTVVFEGWWTIFIPMVMFSNGEFVNFNTHGTVTPSDTHAFIKHSWQWNSKGHCSLGSHKMLLRLPKYQLLLLITCEDSCGRNVSLLEGKDLSKLCCYWFSYRFTDDPEGK